jgi:light-regulated signal transduction histidine kinase (bacteriophytochrome)
MLHAPETLDPDHLLHRIVYRIQRSLALQDILDATVTEVQQFLGMDRIKIYKFHPDASGQVIAECRNADERLPAMQGLHFPADDIPPHARKLFMEARVRNVVNVESGLIGQSRLRDPKTGEVLSEDWAFRPLDPCHQEYLTTMGVQASLGAPIFHGDRMWGLLVAHHAVPREISPEQLLGIQLIVDQLSVAIAQATYLVQAEQKAAREASISRIARLLHSLTTIEWQAALEETVLALQGSGGRLFMQSQLGDLGGENLAAAPTDVEVYTWGAQPVIHERSTRSLFEHNPCVQRYFRAHPARPWMVDDVYQVQDLRTLQSAFRMTAIRSFLVVPLMVRQQTMGYLTIFRDEFATETLWAGARDIDPRQDMPRQSFDAWRHFQAGLSQPWQAGEQTLAQVLAQQFAAAIEQSALYRHVQNLNVNLEVQVQERTLELQQSHEQQKILFAVVAKVRESLDLATMFQTTTQAVRQALGADRVGVFRFIPNTGFDLGEFVSEDVSPDFSPALTTAVQDCCFGEQFSAKYHQGRIHVVADIATAGLQPCHADILSQFQIKAQIVMPLMQRETLWGLLTIHQCDQPRAWKDSEIEFVQQLTTQLGIALEQADLLAQTQRQTTKLAEALERLQHAQVQLIQTEKMSSLGQLVAGIAHEINNPVNFIHGNIVHVSEAMQTLLNLVDFCQQRYGETDADLQDLIEDVDLDFTIQDLHKMLASMQMGTKRIQEIVLSLRNFSRLDQAAMKPVDIHEGIDSTLLMLRHRLQATAESPGIHIVKHYGDLPRVECFASQLNQVLMNILANAIDALELRIPSASQQTAPMAPHTIAITTQTYGLEHIQISITDNGAGILESVRTKLFDPFYTTKPVGKGMGLGLAISYQIITEQHGGTLQCLSTLGEGSQFVITIPIRQITRDVRLMP